MTVHLVYKKEGETPLECLERLREEKGISAAAKLTYLGRLDPMAEGLMLIGENLSQAERENYLHLRKTYTVEMLFGFATDTYDILGKLTDAPTRDTSRRINALNLATALSHIPRKFQQPYPPYSSKPVTDANGNKRPAFTLAREGEVTEEVPTKEVEIYACHLDRMTTIKGSKLLSSIQERIQKVNGDFRQNEIEACWERTLGPLYDLTFDIATITLEVSSGTYVRSIAHHLGQTLGTSAVANRIIRTRVGEWSVIESESK